MSDAVAERMQGVVFRIAAALVDGGVGTLEDTDSGARVGLRWPKGPFEMMNRLGVDKAARLGQVPAPNRPIRPMSHWLRVVPSVPFGVPS